MAHMREYVGFAFTSGLWTLPPSQTANDSLQVTLQLPDPDRFLNRGTTEWSHSFTCATEMLEMKKMAGAFRILRSLFSELAGLMQQQHPRFFAVICLAAATALPLAPQLAQHLLRHTSGLAAIYLPLDHPLSLMLQRLVRMRIPEFRQSVAAILDCYHDLVEQQLGRGFDTCGLFAKFRTGLVQSLAVSGAIDMDAADVGVSKMIRRYERFPDNAQVRRRRCSWHRRKPLVC